MRSDQANIFHAIVVCTALTFIFIVIVGLILCFGEQVGLWDVPGIVRWTE